MTPERLQDVTLAERLRALAKHHETLADILLTQDDSSRQWHMGMSEAYNDAASRVAKAGAAPDATNQEGA